MEYAEIALQGYAPRSLSWPHVVSRLGNSFLPIIQRVLQPKAIGLWPRSPLYDSHGEPADTFEYYPLSSWSHPMNQATLTKAHYASSPFFVLDASNDEARIRKRLGYLLLDQWEFKEHPIAALDSLVEEFGWAGLTFYPDNMLLLLASLPEHEPMVRLVAEKSRDQSITTGRFIRDAEAKVVLEHSDELLRIYD